MPSANKTERLGLNLWAGSDRPQRNDFNSDNTIIDQVLGDHTENEDIHLTADEKARVGMPMVNLSYIGDGNAQKTITIPVAVNAVIVYCEGNPCAVYDSTAGCTKNYMAVSMYGAAPSAGLQFNRTSVTVSQDTQAQSGFMNCLNETSKRYRIIGFR